MAKLLGVEFAPFNIPLHRRLEMLGAFKYVFCFLILGFSCLFLSIYLVLYTRYYWIVLLYYGWMYYDRKTPSRGGRRHERFRRWVIWKYMRDYFPITLTKTADLDPSYNYFFGFHPHGIMSTGAVCNFATEATGFSEKFPGIKPYFVTLSGHFIFPFYRDYMMQAGIIDCTKESVHYVLGETGPGNACIVVIGGALESLEAHAGATTILLKEKKGFIKIALRCGAHLVPVYSFGETDIYEQVPNPEGSLLRKLQLNLQRFLGFAPPIFSGRGIFNYTFGIIPRRRPINTVVGAPIPVKKMTHPTDEDINKLHEIYVRELKHLFDEHKVKYPDYKDKELVIL
ncbi:2-acylglycerol O-acyltransferase 1-like [Glandiceps talaboti]